MEFNNWRSEIIEPGESEISFMTGKKLNIDIKGEGYACARIMSRMDGVSEYSICDITADYELKSDGREYKFIPVITQFDKDGSCLCGDYFEINGQIHISLKINPSAEYIECEYLLYTFGSASLKVGNISVQPGREKKERKVNVATAYFPRPYTSDHEDVMRSVERILDNASIDENKPDIICFTETTYDRGTVNTEKTKWISADSEPVKRICRKAKETGMYVIFSIHELDGKRKYNTALIISNEGEIVGKYRKTHLTYVEVEDGINPGPELPVFELPFGKIGIMICWDQWFPGVASTLFKKGAEIVFVPTAGNPVPIYCSRAYENGGYLVVSGCYDDMPSASCVVSQKGEIIAAVDDVEKGYAVASIDLDEHKHIDWLSFKSGYGANLYPIDLRRDFIIKEEQI